VANGLGSEEGGDMIISCAGKARERIGIADPVVAGELGGDLAHGSQLERQALEAEQAWLMVWFRSHAKGLPPCGVPGKGECGVVADSHIPNSGAFGGIEQPPPATMSPCP
jgi:hypothetical protein